MTVARYQLALVYASAALLCGTLAGGDAAIVESTWDDGSMQEWQVGGDAWVGNESQQLAIRFAAQTQQPSSEASIAWRPADPNFFATRVSFSIRPANRIPSELVLVLRSGYSDLEWRRYLPAPDVGVWTQYSIPVDVAAGWVLGPGTSEAAFHFDRQDVEWIGLSVTRAGAPEEQALFVDDFVVEGRVLTDAVDPDVDTDGDGIPDAWEVRYSLSDADPTDASTDSDGDGMSNYAEYRAGTNPTNDMSVFRLRAASQQTGEGAPGVTLEWDTVRFRRYALWKSTNLVEGFTLEEPGILVDLPRHTYTVPATATDGPTFYRVEVEED